MTLSEIDFGQMFEAHLDGGPAIADFHATTIIKNDSRGNPKPPQHTVELTWQVQPGKMCSALESAVEDFNSEIGGTDKVGGEREPLKVEEANVVGDKAVVSEVFTTSEIVTILGKAISLHSYDNELTH